MRGGWLLSRRMPALARVLLIGAVSCVFAAAMIHFSARMGRLVLYPQFDDVGYFYDAALRTQVLYDHGPWGAVISWLREPPHSPWSTTLATLSFLVLGMHDWAPYAGNTVLIAILLFLVDHLLRGMRFWQKLAGFALVLSVPLCGLSVTEFRPDAAAAIFTAAGAILALDRPLLTASLRRRLLIGACFGLAVFAKPPTAPATAAIFVLVLALAVATAWIGGRPGGRPRVRRLVPVFLAAVIIPLPHLMVAGRNILFYIHRTLYGEERERWQTTLSPGRRAAVYLFGRESGAIMLGSHAAILLGLIALASAALLMGRFRRSPARAGRRAPAFAAMVVVLLAVWLMATANHIVSLWFGALVQFTLLFTAVCAARLLVLPRPGRAIRAGLFLAVAIAAALLLRWPPVAGAVGGTSEMERHRIVAGIYDTIVRANAHRNARVFVMGVGDVNATVLNFRAVRELRQRPSDPRQAGKSVKYGLYFYTARVEDGDRLEPRLEQWDRADFVVISQRETRLTEPSIPEYRILDECIEMLKRQADMRQIGYFVYPPSGKGFYVFQRRPFEGFEAVSGLGPHEEANPRGGDPQVRWGLGPATVLRVTAGTPATLTMSLRNHHHPGQTLEVLADGTSILRLDVEPGKAYSLVTAQLPAGTRRVELRYAKWQENKEMPRAILFRRLTIEPMN